MVLNWLGQDQGILQFCLAQIVFQLLIMLQLLMFVNYDANDPHNGGLRPPVLILLILRPPPVLTPESSREDLLGVGEVGVAAFAGEDLAPTQVLQERPTHFAKNCCFLLLSALVRSKFYR